MNVPRLMPSMLRKKDAKIICKPRNSHIDQKSTWRISCNSPKPLAAHCQVTHAHPANPIRNSTPPESKPFSRVMRLRTRRNDTAAVKALRVAEYFCECPD